ncbi:hypothetical protein [Streptomyces sp. NPDC050560]|uniref:hypothetical protein n=1 Tax=Streptomyces sp. NPDC050560 TaxID=3365630 RepID=UPI00379CBC94
MAIGVLVLVAVGIGAWQLWPESAVGVPGEVCAGTVPGKYVGEVLPKKGEHYKEDFTYGYTTAGRQGRGSGTCTLSGGGKGLGLNFNRVPTSHYGSADLTKDRERAGNTPFTLGPARGFAHGWKVELFTACSSANGKANLEVEVSTTASGKPDDKALGHLAALAGDGMRTIANKLIACKEGTPELPDGSPKVG